MRVEKAVEHLQQLGLSGYEAKAYVALVAASRPLNGYEVAKRSGVPRSTVYETLAKLVARKAAYEVRDEDDGASYLPLPPMSLLDRMTRDFTETVTTLQDVLPSLAEPPDVHLIHNLTGRDAMMSRALDLVSAARRELFLSVFPEEYDVSLKSLAAQAVDNGVDVSVMLFGPEDQPVGHTYIHTMSPPDVVLENLGCRLLVVVADRQQALIAGFVGDEAWGVYTDNPAVVLVAVEYVRHDMAMQILVERLNPDRVREFWDTDPELVRLRADRGLPAAVLRRVAGGGAAGPVRVSPRTDPEGDATGVNGSAVTRRSTRRRREAPHR